jgi:hypothetical protein
MRKYDSLLYHQNTQRGRKEGRKNRIGVSGENEEGNSLQGLIKKGR